MARHPQNGIGGRRRLLAGTSLLTDTAEINEVALSDGVQLVKFDPLPNLGLFEQSNHVGIEVKGLDAKCTTLVKTSGSPDSNNVFIRHAIREPCFVEFQVVRSRDEMSFGVTYEAEQVEKASGYANLRLTTTWVYSKRQAMPVSLFAGKMDDPAGESGLLEGDCVAVYTDPQEQLVKFYRNGKLAASNLPGSPLPAENDRPLRIYAMVDAVHDEVAVIRFGPGEPYL